MATATPRSEPWRAWRTVIRLGALLGLWLLAGVAATAAAPAGELENGGPAVVKEVLSGDTVLLQDGRTLRLAGIQAPKMAPSLGRGRKAPLADEARAALSQLVLGRSVVLWFGISRIDRHDRMLAYLQRDDGMWLQDRMLDQGWARVYPLPEQAATISRLLAAEQPARAAQRGIWGHRFYQVRNPDGLGHDYDSFQVVEGKVLNAAVVKGQLFLNFGPDWRTDFTIHVPRRALRSFRQRFGDLNLFQGRAVRVRGWVYRHNGPEIRLTVPELLELVEPPSPTPSPVPPAGDSPP